MLIIICLQFYSYTCLQVIFFQQDVAAAVGELTKKFVAFEAANNNKDLLAIMSRIEGHIARMASMQTCSQVVLNSGTPTSPTGIYIQSINEELVRYLFWIVQCII